MLAGAEAGGGADFLKGAVMVTCAAATMIEGTECITFEVRASWGSRGSRRRGGRRRDGHLHSCGCAFTLTSAHNWQLLCDTKVHGTSSSPCPPLCLQSSLAHMQLPYDTLLM